MARRRPPHSHKRACPRRVRRACAPRSRYEPRRLAKPQRSPGEPRRLPLGWLRSVLEVDDETTLQYVGLDTFMFLR
jgi:Late exocytosis, associated with Golgi transport